MSASLWQEQLNDRKRGQYRQGARSRKTVSVEASIAGVMEAAAEILQAIPGIELIDLRQPAVGSQSVNLRVLPAYKREL